MQFFLKWLLASIGLFFTHVGIKAQIEVGKPCPNITLKNIFYNPVKQASIKDLKGKWLILDFWSESCAACFESLPKMNKLKAAFKYSVQPYLIGFSGDNESKTIQDIYERIRLKDSLDLPIIYDSILFKEFGIGYVPFLVIIDSLGIVRAVTNSISVIDLSELIKGRNPPLNKVYTTDEHNKIYHGSFRF